MARDGSSGLSFTTDTDYDGGTWVGNEFYARGQRRGQQQTRDEALLGVFADGGGGGRGKQRQERKKTSGPGAFVMFQSGGVKAGSDGKPKVVAPASAPQQQPQRAGDAAQQEPGTAKPSSNQQFADLMQGSVEAEEAFEAKRKMPPAELHPDFGEFERFTKGFGLKYLKKFGFTGRLGKREQGIASFITVKQRIGRGALGRHGPENDHLKADPELRRFLFKGEEEKEGEGVPGGPLGPEEDDSWRAGADERQASKSRRKQAAKTKYVAATDASAKGEEELVIDMTGPETVILQSAADVTGRGTNRAAAVDPDLPGAALRQRAHQLLVAARADRQALVQRQAGFRRRRELAAEQAAAARRRLAEAESQRATARLAVEAVERAAASVESVIRGGGGGGGTDRLEEVVAACGATVEELSAAARRLGDSGSGDPAAAAATAANLLQAVPSVLEASLGGMVPLWRPLEGLSTTPQAAKAAPAAILCAAVVAASRAIDPDFDPKARALWIVRQRTSSTPASSSEAPASASQDRATRHVLAMVTAVAERHLLPPAAAALADPRQWDARNPQAAVRLVALLAQVASLSSLEALVAAAVRPRLEALLSEEWTPAVQRAVDPWRPWLPGPALAPLRAAAQGACRRLLTRWHPSDPSAARALQRWATVWGAEALDEVLVAGVVPRLVTALRSIQLEPGVADYAPVEWALQWRGILQPRRLACLLEGEVLGPWLLALFERVRQRQGSLEDLVDLYATAKAAFPARMRASPGPVQTAFLQAKRLLAAAGRGGLVPQPPLAAPPHSYAASLAKHAGRAAAPATAAAPAAAASASHAVGGRGVSIREVLEHAAHAAGLELTPHVRGTTTEGKRLLLLAPAGAGAADGRALFIERGVVFVQAAGAAGGGDYEPMSVQEVVAEAVQRSSGSG